MNTLNWWCTIQVDQSLGLTLWNTKIYIYIGWDNNVDSTPANIGIHVSSRFSWSRLCFTRLQKCLMTNKQISCGCTLCYLLQAMHWSVMYALDRNVMLINVSIPSKPVNRRKRSVWRRYSGEVSTILSCLSWFPIEQMRKVEIVQG